MPADSLLDLHSVALDVPSLQTEDLSRAETAEHCELPDETFAQTELRKSFEDLFARHDATWVLVRPPCCEQRSRGVAIDEPVLNGHLEDGPQIEAEMIDDARTERLGLAIEQLLKSASIKLFDRLIADLVYDVSSDSVFGGNGGRELPPAPFERKVGADDELASIGGSRRAKRSAASSLIVAMNRSRST